MNEPSQPVGGCRYYATTGCLLALAAVLLVIFFVAAAGTGFAWIVNALWSLVG
ncbi:MAG TPA: hypothetical protein VIL09_10220 [Microvirga sp.]|jgi:hypothetical protein